MQSYIITVVVTRKMSYCNQSYFGVQVKDEEQSHSRQLRERPLNSRMFKKQHKS